jgi:prevent-host-death family protein
MPTYTIHQAKTNLSELIRRAEAGEEIVIARGKQPVAVLKDYAQEQRAKPRIKGWGALKGRIHVADDSVWFGPMSDSDKKEMFGDEFAELMKGHEKQP